MTRADIPLPQPRRFGETSRTDAWWLQPSVVFLGFLAFVIYGNVVLFQGRHFEIRQNAADFSGPEVAPYLAPFYAPLIYDAHSSHAWIKKARPDWWPDWMPFSSAMLILVFPLGFRFTCYYYRGAYYKAFWGDPLNCAVGEPRSSYWGERSGPLILQNIHRYFFYAAVVFAVLLGWDALKAFWWPTDRSGAMLPAGEHQFGIGLGSLIMVVNVVLIACYTFGCHSLRHLIGGRKDSIAASGSAPAYRCVSCLNRCHPLWAWLSLISVGFTDFYIRMCSMGIWSDWRIF
jgi:hypothetical protein